MSQVITGKVIEKTRWQKKEMTTVNTPSQLDFNNLVSGETYRLTLNLILQNNNNEDIGLDVIDPDGVTTILDRTGLFQTAASITILPRLIGPSVIFTAQASGSLSFSLDTNTGDLSVGTFAILEHLPSHEETTDFT